MCSHVKNGQYSISTYPTPIPPAATHAATGAAGKGVPAAANASRAETSPFTGHLSEMVDEERTCHVFHGIGCRYFHVFVI